MRKLLAIIALVLAPGLAQAQTYSGTLYPNSLPASCTAINCTFTTPTLTIASSTGAIQIGSAADVGIARNAANQLRITDGSTGYGRLTLDNGTFGSVPGILFDSGVAIHANSNTNIAFGTASAGWVGASATSVHVNASTQFVWSSNNLLNDAADTGLARAAAGSVRVSDGAAGIGGLRFARSIFTNTGTSTVDLGASNSGLLVLNTGDADGSAVTLPNDPVAGTFYVFAAVAAQDITITKNTGETLYFGNTVCATSLVIGGAATGIGDSVTITAVTGGSGGIWMVTAFAGTPVCT